MNDQNPMGRNSRANAIADGRLIQVTEAAATTAGFVCTIAMTRSVWFECVDVINDRRVSRDRLSRILAMLRCAILNSPALGFVRKPHREYRFFVRNGADASTLLKACSGHDDGGRPCLTVMLASEDQRIWQSLESRRGAKRSDPTRRTPIS